MKKPAFNILGTEFTTYQEAMGYQRFKLFGLSEDFSRLSFAARSAAEIFERLGIAMPKPQRRGTKKHPLLRAVTRRRK